MLGGSCPAVPVSTVDTAQPCSFSLRTQLTSDHHMLLTMKPAKQIRLPRKYLQLHCDLRTMWC